MYLVDTKVWAWTLGIMAVCMVIGWLFWLFWL